MRAPRFDTILTFLRVRDLSATRDFYERDLGLAVVRDQGSCLILAAGSGFVGFCQADDGDDGDERSRDLVLTIVTDDVDTAFERLRRLGVEVEGPPRHHAGFGIRHFFARDPDGYRLEVQRFDEPL